MKNITVAEALAANQIVMTRAITDHLTEDSEFSKFVWDSVKRFLTHDWRDTSSGDKSKNDAAIKAWAEIEKKH